ncbi:hypothetical protein H0N99_05040 [Candidatus Micrarchaeota archaeon]|nr:hypothetical protein [Candidatus Micrarchaeota archaeon]
MLIKVPKQFKVKILKNPRENKQKREDELQMVEPLGDETKNLFDKYDDWNFIIIKWKKDSEETDIRYATNIVENVPFPEVLGILENSKGPVMEIIFGGD